MDSGPGDETLLVAVAERDMGAFRTLYDRHAGWLAIRLARRCNDHDLVADAIQDTFVAVWQKPPGFRGDGDIANRSSASPRSRCRSAPLLCARSPWCRSPAAA
jgi:Sigma-70 region 2